MIIYSPNSPKLIERLERAQENEITGDLGLIHFVRQDDLSKKPRGFGVDTGNILDLLKEKGQPVSLEGLRKLADSDGDAIWERRFNPPTN